MPLILAPYTLGTQLPAAPTVAGGGGWYMRKRRWMEMLVLLLCVGLL